MSQTLPIGIDREILEGLRESSITLRRHKAFVIGAYLGAAASYIIVSQKLLKNLNPKKN